MRKISEVGAPLETERVHADIGIRVRQAGDAGRVRCVSTPPSWRLKSIVLPPRAVQLGGSDATEAGVTYIRERVLGLPIGSLELYPPFEIDLRARIEECKVRISSYVGVSDLLAPP